MNTIPFRKPRQAAATIANRVGIVDIGSNSIRLVVYQGAARLPVILFNEKVLAGLGRSLNQTGAIDAAAMTMARGALARFAALAREMQVGELRVVATAAVREASNGHEIIEAAACGSSLAPPLAGAFSVAPLASSAGGRRRALLVRSSGTVPR